MTDLCAEIPVLTLDKVFQDAIEVTCNLGLAYLWVDSLCIIQDSSSDWAAESVKMGAIYKNAVCNIAAANIISDDAGTESVLFSREQRPSFHHFSPHVCISWRSEDTLNDSQEHRDKTMAIEVGGYYTIRDPMQWLTTVDKTPLNRRGWISQERELSPCILHFDSQQLYWRCSELLACESYPNGIPYMDRSHKYCTTRSFRDLVEEQATASVAAVAAATVTEARESVLRFWGDFVERYSATELTYKSDKLPAAFGMACELERLMPQNRFLAGLWESHLAEGLLWSVVREEDPGMVGPTDILIPDHYRVPTWSWASLHHPVVYLKEPTTPFHLVSSIFEDGLTTDQNQPDDDTNSPFVVCNRLRITTSRPLMALADALERSAYVDKSNTTKNPFYLFPDIWGPTIEIPKSAAELPPPSQANTASPSDDAAAEQRKLSTRTLILPILEEPLGYTAVGLLVNEIIPDGNISGGLGGDVEMFSRIGTFRAYYHDEAQLRTVFPDAAADGDGEDEGDGVDQAQAASRDYTGKTCIYLV
ncbi:heterokaryon incompatibility protein-domain-containing protein [Apodospora peruviana]|uniref:Heterokaryon incompatibility protein-domain-containing protein n=1 Tax=Apodospora peruviana TaxID=516989 RepID=A0AAE0IJD4_9PEZI|nr:heterokaryon incompatibility protein-domain-containing protein [Apodospora peruviana]